MSWPAVVGPLAVAALLLLVTLAVVLDGPAGPLGSLRPADTSTEPGNTSIIAGSRAADGAFAGQPGNAEPGSVLERAGAPFIEGEHFFAVPNPSLVPGVGDRISVWIFYLWSCLHCYALEAELAEWIATVDTRDVDVARVPVQWNALAELHARAFYAAQRLGVAEEIDRLFFMAIHEGGVLLDTRDAIAAVFESAGIDQAEFAAVFDSQGLDGVLERSRSLAEAFGIDATPTIVVGDAYKTTPVATGSPEQTFAVVDWLIAALERGVTPEVGPMLSAPLPVPQERIESEEFRERISEFRQQVPPAPGGTPIDTLLRTIECEGVEPELDDRIEAVRREIDGLRLRLSEEHPDVVSAERVLESLLAERQSQEAAALERCVTRAQQP